MANEKARTDKDETFLVRLKPRDVRKGYLMGSYTVFGIRFLESRGWHRVKRTLVTASNKDAGKTISVDLIDYLSKVHQKNDNPESPLAFDICTEAEAREIDKKERRAKAAKKTATARDPFDVSSGANDLSVEDLNGGRSDDDEEDDEEEEERPARRR